MQNFVKTGAILIVIFFICALSNPAAAQEQDKPPENAAIVNGKPIPYKDYAMELELFQKRMQAQGKQVPPDYLPKLRTELLDDLVNLELLYQQSKKQGVQVKPEEVEKELAALKERYPDPKQFEMILKNMNLTEAQLKEQFARRSSIRALVEKDIAPKVEVTEKEAKNFYETNPNFFEKPEEVRASHILIKVEPGASDQEKSEARKKLTDLKKKIDAGEDFAELAKKHSEGPSNVRGGDLGYFSKGKMVPAFEEKAFSMKPDEVSGIVETQFGLHLIKVLDHKAAGKVDYKEAEPKIMDNLRNKEIQEKLLTYLGELRQDAKIEKFIDQTQTK